jgi:GntR family transcriptional repressor for pyruvate dehydrogenase complex
MEAATKYGAVVTDSVSKQIAERLREAILEGRLKVGERLPTEEELAQRYGVSRASIREALKRLAAQSLIYARRGPTGGNFVTDPDPERLSESLMSSTTVLVSMGAFEFDEIVAARLEMGGICCRLAAQNRTDEDIVALRAALEHQKQASLTDEQFCAADIRFHRCIVNAAKNGPLRFMMYAVVEAMMPITNMVIFRVRDRAEIIKYHSTILDAIERGDAEAAVEALAELITYLSERYRESTLRRQARSAP